MSKSNFVSEMVEYIGDDTFCGWKEFSLVASILLRKNGFIGSDSHFSVRVMERPDSLRIDFEHKNMAVDDNRTHAKSVVVCSDHVGEDNTLSSEVVTCLCETLVDWVTEVEKGSVFVSKKEVEKSDIILADIGRFKSVDHPYFTGVEKLTLSGELDLMTVDYISAFGISGHLYNTGERVFTTWDGLKGLNPFRQRHITPPHIRASSTAKRW